MSLVVVVIVVVVVVVLMCCVTSMGSRFGVTLRMSRNALQIL